TKETKQPEASAAPNAAENNQQPTASPVDATTVASQERTRVMGIIGCEEAKGREEMASKLASMPNMSIEDAQGLLAAAPKADSNNSAAEALAALEAGHGANLESGAETPESGDDVSAVAMLLGNSAN
ncbi:hypothetical protein EAY31_28300, partial [Vibrio anguillarum]|nr:hypothetical protein [Vibrio anguillarum]